MERGIRIWKSGQRAYNDDGSNDVVVLGVEKKSVLQLQDPLTVRKVAMLDDHVCLAFAGIFVASSD